MRLTFSPSDHVYLVDGKTVDSVSQILGKAGLIDTTWYKPSGTNRGTDIHQCIEMVNNGILDIDSFGGTEHEPYMSAYRDFLEQSGFKPVLSEIIVYHETLNYCGTVDIIGILNGKPCIVDVKTGGKQEWHGIQLNAYREPVNKSMYLYKLSEVDESGECECEPVANHFIDQEIALRVLYLQKNGKYKFDKDHKGELFEGMMYRKRFIDTFCKRNILA